MGVSGDADHQLPLRGVVICCTSIEPEVRTEIAAWAAEMGAEHKLDLTSDVTHLVVGETQTPKYKYVAREREDVKCLSVEWIPAVRAVWMQGTDVPLKELEDQHKIPVFYQGRICITGFEDPDQRKNIETLIVKFGGEYRGDLKKDCTHLICHSPVGPKYTSAKAWGNIYTVSIEWLSMSIERGLLLDECYFDPLMPPEERGKDAWKRMERRSPSLKRSRTDELKTEGTRKLRRTASSRFSSDTVWNDIVPGDSSREAPDGFTRTHRGSLSRTTTIASEAQASDVQSDTESVLRGVDTRNGVSVSKPNPRQGIFHGKRFLLHGFDKRRVELLQRHLESQDAEVKSDVSSFAHMANSSTDFTIIPHDLTQEKLSTPSIPSNQLVTELWVEKCLHKKAFLDPHVEPAHIPFKHPLAGFEMLTISSTGFEGVELMHLAKIVKLLGAAYSESLTKTTTLLLCFDDSTARSKFRHAVGWKIPAVRAAWFWDCLRAGQYLPWTDYLAHPYLQKNNTTSAQAPAACQVANDAQPGAKKKLFGRTLGQVDGATNNGRVSTSFAEINSAATTQEDSLVVQAVAVPAAQRFVSRSNSVGQQSIEALSELSPNLQHIGLSPRKPLSAMRKQEDQSLVTSLHTLLAKSREQKAQAALGSRPETERKTRRIFGRARSDLSTRSSVSRAESVDSMNTDGMGTPLEIASRTTPKKPKAQPLIITDDNTPLSAELLLSHDEHLQALHVEEDQAPAMTQIGYDDSEAVLWRARLAKKISGLDDGVHTETADEAEPTPRKPVLKESGQTISKRTRQNTK